MRISVTLYSNCILNDKYQNVFSTGIYDGASILNKYLNSLSHLGFTLENTYYENEQDLVLERFIFDNYDIYSFNYMKVEQYNDNNVKTLTRYCFINRIQVKNSLVYVSFKEDIWSSYSDKIRGILPSYLISSRAKEYRTFTPEILKLPENYDGSHNLSLNALKSEKVYILAEIQTFYVTSASDPIDARYSCYALISNYEGTEFTFNITELYQRLVDLFIFSSGAKLCFINDLNSKKNYSVGDIYILPSDFNLSRFIGNDIVMVLDDNAGSVTIPNTSRFRMYELNRNLMTEYYDVYTHYFQNDFKRISLGTHSQQFKVVNNGNSITYKVQFSYDLSNISLRLNLQNQIYDITDSYSFNYSSIPITADAAQQRKIANQIKNAQLNAQSFKSGVNIGVGLTGMFTSFMAGWITYDETQKISLPYMNSNALSTGRFLSGIGDAISASKQQKLINSKMYSTSQSYWGNSKFFVNYFTLYLECSILPSNENFIKDIINNDGYDTSVIIKEYDKLENENPTYWLSLNEPINYNTIKFVSANVYGSFTDEIASYLNLILENGVKIWFDYQMRDDNYVI